MKMLIKVVPAVIALSCISPVMADTEFQESVPLEVVMQFIGGSPQQQSKLYSDVLSAFPAFTVPAGFTVMGSADQGFMRRVVLRTELDAAAAFDAITAAFTPTNWVLLQDPGTLASQVGFVSAAPVPQFRQLCHDDLGRITLSVNESSGVRYLSLSHSSVGGPMSVQPTCAQQMDPAGYGMRGMGTTLSQYVPRLMLPKSNAAVPPINSFGTGSGSMTDWEARNTLGSDWDIDRITQHFVEQIDAQGWQKEAIAIGDTATMGTWTRTVDDKKLIGTLSIIEQADDVWDLRFRLVMAGAQNQQGVRFISN